MVNDTNYGLFGASEEFTDQDVDKIIATNLTGAIQMIHAEIPFMREQQVGGIIQISSYGRQVVELMHEYGNNPSYPSWLC
ncbi:SDR family NAD(P)-dependent oxidoreductase [Enterococcus silesiacus]|uniref:SDR family NAD(P)-dependent oxidoreductase n=1 Tax=Enterococcus silesiacus TaxID=332949 RepID=UPI001FEBD807|nr:SDR family NAD(P)-dependent oxidoreductase [Enterococcus silesiacus]